MKMYRVAGIGMIFWISAALAMDQKTGSALVEPATPSSEIGTPHSWVLDLEASEVPQLNLSSPSHLRRATQTGSSYSSADAGKTTTLPISSNATKQSTNFLWGSGWLSWTSWGTGCSTEQEKQPITNASLQQIQTVFAQTPSPLSTNKQPKKEQSGANTSTIAATAQVEPVQTLAAAALMVDQLNRQQEQRLDNVVENFTDLPVESAMSMGECAATESDEQPSEGLVSLLTGDKCHQEAPRVYGTMWAQMAEKAAEWKPTHQKKEQALKLAKDFVSVPDDKKLITQRFAVKPEESDALDEKEVRDRNYERKSKGQEKHKREKLTLIDAAVQRQRRAAHRQSQSRNLMYTRPSVKSYAAREKQKRAKQQQQRLIGNEWSTQE